MPMHAQRDIVMSNPSIYLSVCPLVRHTLELYRNYVNVKAEQQVD